MDSASTVSENSKSQPAEADAQETVPSEPSLLKKQLDELKHGRVALSVLTTLAVIYAIYFTRAILFPIALAVVLYFLLAPLVRLIAKIRIVPESLAAAVVVLAQASF